MRRVIVLAGEHVSVETPQGSIMVFVRQDGRVTTGTVSRYTGVAGWTSLIRMETPTKVNEDWVAQWRVKRQPKALYNLFRKEG